MNLTQKSFIFIPLAFLLFYHQAFSAQEGASTSGVKKSSNIQQNSKSDRPATQPAAGQLKAGQNEQAGPEAGKVKSFQAKPKPAKEPFMSNEELFRKINVQAEPPLQIFGHNIFAGSKTSFTPIDAVPVSKDYLIGPGDEIKVVLWGRMDASYTLEVDNNGEIVFPKVGPLTVAGLSFAQLEELVKLKLEAMTGVNVNVSMGKLRSIQVFVLGEVKNPGIYRVSALATIANALHAGGGLSALASLRKIELRRQKKMVTVSDLYDFLLKGDTSSDARLMSADVIFVPQAGPMVSVSGNVKRPAIYELKNDLSIENALKLAGGLKPDAYNQRIQIMRPFEHQVKLILDASYKDVSKLSEITLQDGDWIRISPILPILVNAVYLYGNVLRPGEYEYKPGYGVLDILPDLESLDMDSYFDYAVVKRYHYESMEAELIPFDLGKLLFQKDKAQNIPLEPLDEIYVFNKWLFEDRDYASVSGQVRKPGRYYVEEMKVKDLVFKAGDLTLDAYLPRAELIRTDQGRRKRTIYLDLAEAIRGNPQHNIKIQNEDSLVIHSIWEAQWKKFVAIKGEIKKPGRYALTREMRLSDLIFKSGNFTQDAYMELGHLYRTDRRTREVTIYTINVAKALEGNVGNNLLLKDLDQVVIHNIGEYKPKYTVSIKGMVHQPGEYPFAANMTIRDLIVVGGSIRDGAYLEKGELVRYQIVDGEEVVAALISFDVNLALRKDSANDLPLQPMDVVQIKKIPGWWEKKKTVTLAGEVSLPGTYQILSRERLSDVLERAGGFTKEAYLKGAFFTRASVREKQKQELNGLLKRLEIDIASLAALENEAFLSEEALSNRAYLLAAQNSLLTKLREKKPTGRVIISLVPLEKLAGSPSDLFLETGDRLFIPKNPNTVYVLGAVYQPVTAVYDRQRGSLSYYLDLAGGPTENAQLDQIYIVRTDGSVVSQSGRPENFEKTLLYPGDSIIVPHQGIRPTYLHTLAEADHAPN